MDAMEDDRPGNGQAAALERVLDAEKEAAQRIARARVEAESILASAKQAARTEAARADRRIQALHGCAGKALKAKRAALDDEFRHIAAASNAELSDAEIDRLVARLARRLTGQRG